MPTNAKTVKVHVQTIVVGPRSDPSVGDRAGIWSNGVTRARSGGIFEQKVEESLPTME